MDALNLIESSLKNLEKSNGVFLQDFSYLENDIWETYQLREKNHWKMLDETDFHPDIEQEFLNCLVKWDVPSNYFSGKSVLEIGTGAFGFFSAIAHDNNLLPKCLVVADPLMVFFQELKLSKKMPEKAIRINAPGEDLPLPDNSIDLVVTNNTIDHVNDCEAFLKEINRVLKPGGEVLFMLHVLYNFTRPFIPFVRLLDRNHPHHFIHREVFYFLNLHGFCLIKNEIGPLYKEIKIPHNISFTKKILCFIAFRIMFSMYGRAFKEPI